MSDTLKVLYGVRYDLYDVPAPNASAPFDTSRDFVVDKNNFAPRLGVVWTVGSDRRTVVRANTGMMYDQALLASYEQALINDGTNARAAATFQPATPDAPAFPNVLAAGAGATPNTLTTVSREFDVAHNWQNNVQLERQLSDRFAASVGVSYARGYNLPLISNINLINPIGQLSDGRHIYSTAVNAGTRVDPRYNVVNQIESLGESTYKNFTAQLTGRNVFGMQFDFAYTLGKSEDNAPITSVLSVQGDAGPLQPRRPRLRQGAERARPAPHLLGQRRRPSDHRRRQRPDPRASSTAPSSAWPCSLPAACRSTCAPIRARSTTTASAATARPVSRATRCNLPARYNVDLRLSRQVPLGGARKAEVIAEVKNVFNTVQWSAVSNANVAVVPGTGAPVSALPTSGDQFIPSAGYEQRQLQIGFRFVF